MAALIRALRPALRPYVLHPTEGRFKNILLRKEEFLWPNHYAISHGKKRADSFSCLLPFVRRFGKGFISDVKESQCSPRNLMKMRFALAFEIYTDMPQWITRHETDHSLF